MKTVPFASKLLCHQQHYWSRDWDSPGLLEHCSNWAIVKLHQIALFGENGLNTQGKCTWFTSNRKLHNMKKKKKEKTREKKHMVHKKDTLLINLSNFIHTHIYTHTHKILFFKPPLFQVSGFCFVIQLGFHAQWVLPHYRSCCIVGRVFYLGFTALWVSLHFGFDYNAD